MKLMSALDELEKLVENIQGFDDTIAYRTRQAAVAAADIFSGMACNIHLRYSDDVGVLRAN